MRTRGSTSQSCRGWACHGASRGLARPALGGDLGSGSSCTASLCPRFPCTVSQAGSSPKSTPLYALVLKSEFRLCCLQLPILVQPPPPKPSSAPRGVCLREVTSARTGGGSNLTLKLTQISLWRSQPVPQFSKLGCLGGMSYPLGVSQAWESAAVKRTG